jgi:hypothetical protein
MTNTPNLEHLNDPHQPLSAIPAKRSRTKLASAKKQSQPRKQPARAQSVQEHLIRKMGPDRRPDEFSALARRGADRGQPDGGRFEGHQERGRAGVRKLCFAGHHERAIRFVTFLVGRWRRRRIRIRRRLIVAATIMMMRAVVRMTMSRVLRGVPMSGASPASRRMRMMRAAAQHQVQSDAYRGDERDDGTHINSG